MLRFLFNFVLFGVLFYAIYSFFPDAFKTLVSWADSIYGVIRDFVLWIIDKVNQFRSEHTPSAPSTEPKAIFEYFVNRFIGL